MKKFFATLAALVIFCAGSNLTHAATGPIDQGSIILAGDVGLVANLGTGGSTIFFIDPTLLYFIQEHLAIGGSLGLQTGGGGTLFSLLPTASYYLGERNAKMFPFFTAGLGIQTGFGETNFLARVGGGIASMITKDVCINSTLTFNVAGSNTSLQILAGVGVFIF